MNQIQYTQIPKKVKSSVLIIDNKVNKCEN